MSYDDCYADDAMAYLEDARVDAAKRLSLLEMLFLKAWELFPHRIPPCDDEVNDLLQGQALPIVYRCGRFEPTDGPTTQKEVHDPFWALLGDARWENVRTDMRHALALRDTGGRDPALYAARAYESVLKIISAELGRLPEKVRGASQVIDTLVSNTEGRLIEPWEANMAHRFFAEIRNPSAHGAGAQPQPRLDRIQASWAIEFCMISIKSLILRSQATGPT